MYHDAVYANTYIQVKRKISMCTYERRGKYGISHPKCRHSTEEGCSYLCAGFNTFDTMQMYRSSCIHV